MSIWSADRVVLSAGPSDRGPLAGYRTRAGRVAGIVFTGIWLAYLIGPVVDLITQHYSAIDRAAGLSIIAAFCVIYVTLVPNWPMGPRYAHAWPRRALRAGGGRLHPVRRHGRGQLVDLRVVRLRAARR